MKSEYLLFFLLFPFLYSSSNSSSEQERKLFQLASPIVIDYNQKVLIEEEGVSIKFINVISDSRCPTAAECVWAGEAELQFIASRANDSILFNLINSGQHFGQDTILFDLHIKLAEVIPYPDVSKRIVLKEYKAKLIIDKI